MNIYYVIFSVYLFVMVAMYVNIFYPRKRKSLNEQLEEAYKRSGLSKTIPPPPPRIYKTPTGGNFYSKPDCTIEKSLVIKPPAAKPRIRPAETKSHRL
jgi:hypothetical protein